MNELQKLRKLRQLLSEIAESHGLTLQSFLIDPDSGSVKTIFEVTVEAVKTVEEKETEYFNSEFDKMMQGFKK